MLTKILLKRTIFLFILIGILNFVSTKFYLQWMVWWIGIPLHFLGGLFISLLLFWLYSLKSDLKNLNLLKISLIGVVVAGLLWEIYELSVGLTSLSNGMIYFKDSLLDMVMSFIGGVVGFLYISALLKRPSINS